MTEADIQDVGDDLPARELPKPETLATEPREAWRARFDAYDPLYLGPVSWCRFLKAVAATGSLPFARQLSGISPQLVSKRRERYPEFDVALAAALDHFNSAVLERSAISRAVDGVDEPVFRNDEDGSPIIAGYVRKYSDSLMNTLLKGRMREQYGDKHELTGKDGGPIVVHLHPDDSTL